MKRIYSIVLCLLLLILSACGRLPAEASSTVTPEDSYAQYPYGIQGLTLYQEEAGTRGEGVTLLARLANDAQTAEGYVSIPAFYDLGDGALVLDYAISNCQTMFFEGDGPMEGDVSQQDDLLAYDPVTGEVGNRVTLPQDSGSSICYLTQAGNTLWSWRTGSIRTRVTGYDGSLNKVHEVYLDGDSTGYFTQDGTYYYTLADQALYRCATGDENAAQEAVTLQQEFAVDYLGGLYRDSAGEDYAVITGKAGDLRDYRGIVKLSTGEFVYLVRQDASEYIYQDGPALLCQEWGAGSEHSYLVCVQDAAYRYQNQQEDSYLYLSVLSNGNLLFYYVEEPAEDEEGGAVVLHLWLYDSATGEQLAGTAVPMEGSPYCWLSGTPYVYADGESLLFAVASLEQCTYYYRWSYGGEIAEAGAVTAEPYPFSATVAEVTGQWDPTSFTPGECPEELSDLRARADQMENRYDIKIYISEECSNMIGGYAIEALSDYDQVSAALDILEQELSKYPEHFFNQLEWEWCSGLDIYITGQLIGMNSGNLDFAGGFQTSYMDRQLIALDCTNLYSLDTNIHHEISHAIDTKLQNLDEDIWASLNPVGYGDCYTHTYTQFGREDLVGYTYYGCSSLENLYFVDDYSMTFPTEDRARIFENVMVDEEDQYIDWENSPHLREKLNYYAACIRAEFDTTGWEDVPWERYLDTGDGAAWQQGAA